ncbi:zinc finger protein 664 isoform X1 [Drosophila tropicalis]|uniref:zinc finger protein 664 isoform X1 n=2 Tax=Drosophila tropicalis TaxID=46794 RepID=UPI0035AB6FCB
MSTGSSLCKATARLHCLTCLVKLDTEEECNEIRSQLRTSLGQLLNWQLEELNQLENESWLPQQMCTKCQQLVENVMKFQEMAQKCWQQLMALLTDDIKERELEPEPQDTEQQPTFEVVYEQTVSKPIHDDEDDDADDNGNGNHLPTERDPDPFHSEPEDASAERENKSSKGIMRFKCMLCRRSFAHKLTLSAHIRKVHEGSKRPFECDKCDKSYSFMGGLYTHIKEVHEPTERRHICDQPGCARIYTSSIAMQRHKRLKHSPPTRRGGGNGDATGSSQRKFMCEQCGANFNQSANLKYHRRTKHPTDQEAAANEESSQQHYCELCQKSFHSRYTLRYHTMQQHGNGQKELLPHECEICGRRMAKKFMLLQHMLMHSRDKLPCEHCGRLFARKFELEAHIRAVHLKLKPFTCKYCTESFASRKTLRHHEYIHTGEKPYVCDTCGQAFRQQTCLKNHRKVHDKR